MIHLLILAAHLLASICSTGLPNAAAPPYARLPEKF
jgi:hypothetical protein